MIKNEKPKILTSFSTILGVLAILLSSLVVIFQFSDYIYKMQWFYFWGIDEVFFAQDSISIVNNLMYASFSLGIIIFLLILMYNISNSKNEKIKNWIKFLTFFIPIYSLLSIKSLYNNNFNIILYFLGMLVCLVFLKLYIKKVSKFINILKNKESGFVLWIDLIQNIFIVFIITFIVIIGLGFLNTICTKDYKIIPNDNINSNVILYSTKDYYIIADCIIKDNKLIVYKNTQRKIENDNIVHYRKTFDKIIKK